MGLIIVKPDFADGSKIYELVKRVGTLDLNSEYNYFLLCDIFQDQCAVVKDEQSGDVHGFVSSIKRPDRPNVLFFWQIAVSNQIQGMGYAKKLLDFVIRSQESRIDFVETTISDDNLASKALFKSFARMYRSEMVKEVYIEENQFLNGHEAEYLYKIGKLDY